ncbi:MAG: c-type cytochrome biogenesis protein CcsB [Deltaproteobacteria bacterium]|nr:c-type cytochrome biogenesis protein CcsB [Deltaproteobacteria bacterium]
MLSTTILSIVTFIYLASTFFYFCYLAFRNEVIGKIATGVTVFGLIGHIISFFLRWKESYDLGYGHIPLSNQFESMVFFAMVVVIIYLMMEYKYKIKTTGAFVTPFASILLAMTTITKSFPNKIQPLVPALQSDWLTYHVITCFLGYAAFAISCGVSIMFLIKVKSQKEKGMPGKFVRLLPDKNILEDFNYKAIAIGFPMLTLGIITGAAWANYAWGSYWSWDPKETWSLITWFFYAAFLHARFTRGWRGKKAAILSIVGFGAVIFTYFGVNYILAGLHSYA